MGQLHHATRDGAVIVERQLRTINYHGCVTRIDAAGGEFVTIAMVQMQRYRLLECIRSSVSHSHNHWQTEIVDSRFSCLQDDRFIKRVCGAYMRDQGFRVVKIQCCNSFACARCGGEQRAAGTEL